MTRKISDKDMIGLAGFFYIFWAAAVLNPRNLRNEISVMKSMGLVVKKGKLALTPAGKRALAIFRDRKARRQ